MSDSVLIMLCIFCLLADDGTGPIKFRAAQLIARRRSICGQIGWIICATEGSGIEWRCLLRTFFLSQQSQAKVVTNRDREEDEYDYGDTDGDAHCTKKCEGK